MAVQEKDLGLFDDPTYDDLYARLEKFVDGEREETIEDIADAIELAYQEGRIGQGAYTELMDGVAPFLETNA